MNARFSENARLTTMVLEIILIIATVVFYGAASTIQKYAIKNMKKFNMKELIVDKIWLLSLLIGGLGTYSYLYALKIGLFSFVQTMLSFTIVIPIAAGWLLFKEKLMVVEWLSVGLITAGIILYSV